MRIVFLGNNWLGWQALQWLKSQGEEIVALFVHPVERAKYADEIRSEVAATDCLTFSASQIGDPMVLERLRNLQPEIGVSILFAYLLRADFLGVFERTCINLHPSLLPYNRGAYPNVWSIVEKTPSGVTIHEIDQGVDTGGVIAQKEVSILDTDTGGSLYQRLEAEALSLFKETWPKIRKGGYPRIEQKSDLATFHKLSDVSHIDEIELEKCYKAEDLLNVIRARTFPPHKGAYIRKNGKKIYLRLEMSHE